MAINLPIYLDYAATTPVDPRVAEKMVPYLSQHFGNPAPALIHLAGRRKRRWKKRENRWQHW